MLSFFNLEGLGVVEY